MDGPAPLETLLKTLIAMKKDGLFSDGVYELKACPHDILLVSWEKNGRKAWGIFSLKGKAGVISVSIADGCYQNQLDGTQVWVEGGMLQTNGDPVILMEEVC